MTEVKNDFEIVLKCTLTNEVRVVRRRLIQEHINSLEYKLNEGKVENNFQLVAMYRVNETYEL